MKRTTLGLAAAVLALVLPLSAGAASPPSATPPQNPSTSTNGFSMMHGDTASSDTTPVAGPGPGRVIATPVVLGAVCPSILVGTDGYLLATCTQITTRKPTVYLLDPSTGLPLTSLAVDASGSALGGVYTYLDRAGRVVIVDGHNDLLRIGHRKDGTRWQLYIASSTSLGFAGDTVVGLVPDFLGRIWFATQHGRVGVLDGGKVRSIVLGHGELVGNSISTIPGQTAVVTDHALYLLTATRGSAPRILLRSPYTRGPARKPGQLSWGTGTTPVYFGPHGATDYVAIMDNARPHENLLVYRVATHQRICDLPVLRKSAQSGTEDAVIGYDNTVVATSTYGYPYPAGATGASTPTSAPFVGGMTRVDVTDHGCSIVWDNLTRSSALPRLSLADDLIQTVVSTPASASEGTVYGDSYSYEAIDLATGKPRSTTLLGAGPTYDMLQLVGTTTRTGVLYQGTLTGYVRIAAA